MQVGQHVIAVALAAIGVVRAVAEGTTVFVVVVPAAALLLWYGTGVLLSTRHTGTTRAAGGSWG